MKNSSSFSLLSLFFITLFIVGVSLGVYFGLRNNNGTSGNSGVVNIVNYGKYFRVTYNNSSGNTLQEKYEKNIEEACNFWEDKFLDTETGIIDIDLYGNFLEDSSVLAYASMKDGDNIKGGGEIVINLRSNIINQTDVIKHEMCHVLGIGIHKIWRDAIIIENSYYYLDKNKFEKTYDFYEANYNSGDLEDNIPLGSVAGHFEEKIFGTELMTPYLNDGTAQPATGMTLTALETLGWKIDINKAEPIN